MVSFSRLRGMVVEFFSWPGQHEPSDLYVHLFPAKDYFKRHFLHG